VGWLDSENAQQQHGKLTAIKRKIHSEIANKKRAIALFFRWHTTLFGIF